MDGTALLRGIDLGGLDVPRMLNVLLALQVEQIGGAFASPYTVLQELVTTTEPEAPPTMDTWGMSAEAQAAQEAFMRMGAAR